MSARPQRFAHETLPRYLRQYVFDLIELRQSIRFNEEDTKFAAADKRNEIIYVIDADVACMFLSPRAGSSNVDLFGALSSRNPGEIGSRKSRKNARGDREGDGARAGQFEGLGELSAAVCAEYIFSGQLPGQKHNKALARISYQHAFELEHFLNKQVEKADLKWGQVEREIKDNIAQIRQNLKKRWGLFESEHMSAEEAAKALSESLPQGLREWLLVKALAVRQFRRLTESGKERLAPLGGLQNFTLEMETPPPDVVSRWYDIIQEHRGEGDFSRERNYRDAIVMAQVQALNDVREPHQKYLFVSGSSALHKAVGHWNADHPDPSDKVHFIRHPRQYVALLNMRDMRKAWTHAAPNDPLAEQSVLPDVRETVDMILTTFLEDDVVSKLPSGFKLDELQRSLERKLNLFDVSRNALRQFDDLRDRLREQWTHLTRASIAYSRNALSDMCDEFFDIVKKFVERKSDMVDEALLNQCRSLVGGISKDSVLMGVLGALAILAAKMQEYKKSRRARKGRSPDYVEYDFVGLITEGDRRVNAFLDEVVHSQSDYDRVVAWLSDPARRAVDANFLVGCIFLKTGDWTHARSFLEKAQENWSGDTGNSALYEVKYCLSVAIRLALGGPNAKEDFLAAKQLNEECLKYHASFEKSDAPHTYRTVHTRIELAAAHTSWVVLRCEKPLNAAERAECETLVDQAEGHLNGARHLLDEYFREDEAAAETERAKKITRQLVTNLAGILTLREFVLEQRGAIFKASDIERIKQDLRDIVDGDRDPHFLTKICLLVLTWKSDRDAATARKAGRKAHELIGAALKGAARAELTNFDIVEMEIIEKALATEFDACSGTDAR